jgi:mRNA interferase MazF
MDLVIAVRRFDVYLVDLDPTKGSEMRKTRPCVIVSPDDMNRHIRTVIIAPLTSAIRAYPTRVDVTFADKEGQVALDQIRTIDKSRLLKKLGVLSTAKGRQLAATLQQMFAFH